jgi:hypothetical protein
LRQFCLCNGLVPDLPSEVAVAQRRTVRCGEYECFGIVGDVTVEVFCEDVAEESGDGHDAAAVVLRWPEVEVTADVGERFGDFDAGSVRTGEKYLGSRIDPTASNAEGDDFVPILQLMGRPLGNMEAALQVTRSFAPMSVAGVVRMVGAPEVQIVRDALDIIQRQHPLLQARINNPTHRPWFEVTPEVPPISLEVLPMRSADHWLDVATDVINRNLDVGIGPLLACTYLHDPHNGLGDLVFAYDHSIMDAVSAGQIYEQLLGLCGGTLDQEKLKPRPLTPSLDELLPRLRGVARFRRLGQFMGRQAADEMAYRLGIRGRGATIQPEAGCRTLTRTIDAKATSNLVKRARTHRLTMNSVLAAALVNATHQQLYPGETLPIRAIMFADLRRELSPPPSNDDLGCYLSMLRFTLQIGPDDDLWTVARAFQERLHKSRDRDEHLLVAGLAKQAMKIIVTTKRMRMATTAVSYAGPMPLSERYGDIQVTEVHGFISNNRLGPVATAFATIFRERLTWDFVFLDSDMEPSAAERIADRVVEDLTLAGAR